MHGDRHFKCSNEYRDYAVTKFIEEAAARNMTRRLPVRSIASWLMTLSDSETCGASRSNLTLTGLMVGSANYTIVVF